MEDMFILRLFGKPIESLQSYLRQIANIISIDKVVPTGTFDEQTQKTVEQFQAYYDLPATGVVDEQTWNKVLQIFENIERSEIENVFPQFED